MVELYQTTVGDGPAHSMSTGSTARVAIEGMLHESVKIFCGANTPHGCLLVLGRHDLHPRQQGTGATVLLP